MLEVESGDIRLRGFSPETAWLLDESKVTKPPKGPSTPEKGSKTPPKTTPSYGGVGFPTKNDYNQKV